ncbi:hypothetical protein BDV12DRAFT_200269 [Aspergillus spectabilis]
MAASPNTRALVSRLPTDILHEIFRFLVDEEQQLVVASSGSASPFLNPTLSALAFFSPQVYFAARPFLYRSICLSNIRQVRGLFRTLTECPPLIKTVRNITLFELHNLDGAVDWPMPPDLTHFRYHPVDTETTPTSHPILASLITTLPAYLARQRLPNLKTLEISGLDSPDWSSFVKEVISSPTMYTLQLTSGLLGACITAMPLTQASSTLRELRILVPFPPDGLLELSKKIQRLEVVHYLFRPYCFKNHNSIASLFQALHYHNNTITELDLSPS